MSSNDYLFLNVHFHSSFVFALVVQPSHLLIWKVVQVNPSQRNVHFPHMGLNKFYSAIFLTFKGLYFHIILTMQFL